MDYMNPHQGTGSMIAALKRIIRDSTHNDFDRENVDYALRNIGIFQDDFDTIVCYKCERTGHMARNCPEKIRMCYNCNTIGHYARDCIEPKKKKPKTNDEKSDNASSKDSAKGNDKTCFLCGSRDHLKFACPKAKKTDNVDGKVNSTEAAKAKPSGGDKKDVGNDGKSEAPSTKNEDSAKKVDKTEESKPNKDSKKSSKEATEPKKACWQCGRTGHIARDCRNPHAKNRGPLGGGDRRRDNIGDVCFRCGEPGHFAKDCDDYTTRTANVLELLVEALSDNPNQGEGCFNCGEPGHFARECPRMNRGDMNMPGGRGFHDGRGNPGESCFVCGDFGHFARDCPSHDRVGGRNFHDGPRRPSENPNEGCFLCGSRGHFARECPGNEGNKDAAPRQGFQDRPGEIESCFICGGRGHFARECPRKDNGPNRGPNQNVNPMDSCYHCGERGHFARECPRMNNSNRNVNMRGGGPGANQGEPCFVCGDLGHFARECPRNNSNRNVNQPFFENAGGNRNIGPNGGNRNVGPNGGGNRNAGPNGGGNRNMGPNPGPLMMQNFNNFNNVKEAGNAYKSNMGDVPEGLNVNNPCLTCGRNNHVTFDCPIAKQCYRCGNTNHIAKDCPERSLSPPDSFQRSGFRDEQLHSQPFQQSFQQQIQNQQMQQQQQMRQQQLQQQQQIQQQLMLMMSSKNDNMMQQPGPSRNSINDEDRCFRCGRFGHRAYQCSESKNCYRCGRSGHEARDCNEASGDICLKCKKTGHMTFMCQYSNDERDRGSPMGMRSVDRDDGAADMKCYRCGRLGHAARDCGEEKVCYKCNRGGHIARECPMGSGEGLAGLPGNMREDGNRFRPMNRQRER